MKQVSRAAYPWMVSAAVLACCPLIASGDDGPYVGVEGGVNWQSPQDQDTVGVVTDRLHFKKGWEAGVVSGYSFMNGWRPELELSYRRDPIPGGNHDNNGAALANVWYDIKTADGIFSIVHPYFGGGAGGVRYNNNGFFFPNRTYNTEFGYQAGGGIGFDATPNLTISLDYRHLWTQRGGYFATFPVPGEYNDRYLANTALLSVRWSFGAPPATPVAVAPPPPPPPPEPVTAPAPPPPPVVVVAPPPCNPPAGFKVDANCHIIDQVVVVRAVDFELNSTRLTLPSQQTLEQVAQALSAQPGMRVEVAGYTDSTGPLPYNMKLSQGRADAVRDYLVSKGVSSSSLTARGYGPEDPIASNKSVAGRAQNRRVTFKVTSTPEHVKVNTEDATEASTEAAQQNDTAKPRK
jgi:OOP family OmpA-OmpF porin